MKKDLLVVSSWVDKTTGRPFCSLAEIKRGLTKEGGRPYEMLADYRETVEGKYSVGTVLSGTLSLSIANDEPDEPQQRGLKLGTSK